MEATESVQERRSFKRIKLSEPVHFQLKDSHEYGGCLTADISAGGVRINFNDFVPVNTEFVLQLQLASQKMIDCVGRVVWVEQMPYSDRYQVGLKFENTGSLVGSQREINDFIKLRETRSLKSMF